MGFFVYIHTNKLNGKRYVGLTTSTPKQRWGKNGYGYRNNKHFYSAIQEYGWDNFQHEVMEVSTKEEMYEQEQQLIALYKTTDAMYGYNHSIGGEHSASGYVFTEEQRQHLREVNKGRTSWNKGVSCSPEMRKRLSAATKGRPKSDETKLRMRKPKSEEHKQHISEALIGRKRSAEHSQHIREALLGNLCGAKNPHSKTVLQFDKDGSFIKEWSCIVDASKSLQVSADSISACCRGKYKTAGGFVWKFKKE